MSLAVGLAHVARRLRETLQVRDSAIWTAAFAASRDDVDGMRAALRLVARASQTIAQLCADLADADGADLTPCRPQKG